MITRAVGGGILMKGKEKIWWANGVWHYKATHRSGTMLFESGHHLRAIHPSVTDEDMTEARKRIIPKRMDTR